MNESGFCIPLLTSSLVLGLRMPTTEFGRRARDGIRDLDIRCMMLAPSDSTVHLENLQPRLGCLVALGVDHIKALQRWHIHGSLAA